MLNSGKKICALRDKKINILTLVLSEEKFRNKAKNHNPPSFKLNGPPKTSLTYLPTTQAEGRWRQLPLKLGRFAP
jgi:hypothetical protein